MLIELKFYLISALVVASVWCLPAVGVSLLYGVLRYPNFAITEYMTVGAYAALLYCSVLPFWAAIGLAILTTGLIALVWDQLAFRAIRQAGAMPAILMSLGLMLVLQNLVRFGWGNATRQFPVPLVRPLDIAGFLVTPLQAASITGTAALLVAFFVVLRYGAAGRSVRAISDNPDLALVSGVRPELVYGSVTFVSGALAGCGGIILALETSLSPLLGWRSLIPIFAVAVLGGLGSASGAAIAALLLAGISEFSLFLLPATYKTALAFLVLALVLMMRPGGLMKAGT